MPVPILILGATGVAALVGVVKGTNAVNKNGHAKKINYKAKSMFDCAKSVAENARTKSNTSLEMLGETKLKVLDQSVNRFVSVFDKIHNLTIKDSVGLDEIGKFRIDKQSIYIMRDMGKMAKSVVSGLVGGTGAGALVAFGAYGATMTLAAASTGTAIATLSGVAATNATLAFLGGGAIAAGGGGMALGSVVLGGVVAGPALAILGIWMNASANKNLDNAYTNEAQANKIAEELNVVTTICYGIAKRADMFRSLLVKLDSVLINFTEQLESIVANSGTDYSKYSEQEQGTVAMSLSLAGAIKKVLDTPILADDGKLLDESKTTHAAMTKYIESVETKVL